MIVTRRSISRRTVLRGLGVSMALPFLDAMVPALTALRKTPAASPRRLSVVYVPNGIVMDQWTPAAEGTAFELQPIMRPLAPFRNQLLVVSGLQSKPYGTVLAGGGFHPRASTRFLTDVPPRQTDGAALHAGVSMDQIAAKELGRDTQLASLEVGLDSRDFSGSCGFGFSCGYTNTISWRTPTTPLPMENNPRVVFERLFGDTGTTDPAIRQTRLRERRSILDAITGEIATLQRDLDSSDRGKITQYLESVRDAERRIERAEEQREREVPSVDEPAGIPDSFDEHARLMFELQALALQCDLTRVMTFMIGRELSGRAYPELGVTDAHHPTSHHMNDPVKIANLVKINTFHVTLFAHYLNRLRTTPDGDGSLLDHLIVMYGSGMSDGQTHAYDHLPILLVGGRSDVIGGGRHLVLPSDTPLANLHLTLLDKLGVPGVDRLGDSTGRSELPAIG